MGTVEVYFHTFLTSIRNRGISALFQGHFIHSDSDTEFVVHLVGE
jgi:hypothetical protein